MINIDALNDDEKLAALESIHKSIAQSKEIQKKKITTNVELIVKALKKIESDLQQRYDETGKLIANLKNGEDGRDGKDGKDGRDGKNGRDGAIGPRGYDGIAGRNGADGQDGVSVVDAQIDFDGSLTITLSNGNVINAGEIVNLDLAEKIKVITNGGGTSQFVLDALASLEAQISQITSGLEYQGTWNASTNVPTLASSVGTAGYYYIVATAGSTNLNGVTDWQVGDWAVFNGTVWQKIDQTNLVTSVAGRTGAIVLTTADIGGLGTIATQASSNVSITGGSITGITDLAIADGGTGQSTAAAAITALTGTQVSGRYLRSNGTNAVLAAIVAADVPTLNQNTTGTSANVTGTVAIANGGTGQTTANAAFNALVPSQTSNSGKYLTTNGTDTSWATNPLGTVTSVAASVPTFLSIAGSPITTSGTLAITLSGTALPVANGGTGITSFGTGVATFLGTPSSANLASAVTDETGSGALVFATSPTLVTPALGTPSSGVATNLTGLPLTTGVTGTLPTANGGTNLTSFTANGVVYASSTSALATGSALTFNGTQVFTVGTTGGNVKAVGTTGITVLTADTGSNNIQVQSRPDISYSRLISSAYLLDIAISVDQPITFTTNGSERMRVNATGLGIGTSSPSYKLDVRGTGTQTIAIRTQTSGDAKLLLENAGSNSGSITYSRSGQALLFSGQDATTHMTLDNAGNLGIGTTSPAVKLDVAGGSSADVITIRGRTSDNFGLLSFATSAGTKNAYIGSNDSTILTFYTNGFNERARIDTSGNLLVGTTSASGISNKYIEINDATDNCAINLKVADVGQGYVYVDDSSNEMRIAATGASNVNALTLWAGGSERARIDSSGNLLVGTTSVAAKLTVEQGSANANGAFITNQTYNYQTLGLHNTATANDNIWVTFGTEASFTTRGSITYNRAGGLTAYNVTSDYRAKDIIGPVTNSGALIDSTPVYMGKMKGATQERPMFIAHETPVYAHTGEKDAVDADGNPVYQQMDASALIPVMWAEIQSLRKRLADAGI